MIALKNVLLSTARSTLNAQGGTNPPSPHLSGVPAHGRTATTGDYRIISGVSLESDYVFAVEAGTDIIAEDVLTSVTENDGVTPWAQAVTNANETLRVVLAQDMAPGPLTYRAVYVKKITGGGLAY